jgi:hypothetical protein
MATSDTATKAGSYAQRLLDNDYVQENLADAVKSLRAAYGRASKRRVEPTTDEKLRRQVRQAASSLSEAASALRAGRTKPKRRWGRRMLFGLALGAGATAAVLAANGDLRRRILGHDESAGTEVSA